MNDFAEELSKIVAFLAGEFARKDNRQCTHVDLLFRPGSGYRDETIRQWVRAGEDAELFDLEQFANVEKLAKMILDIAEQEADAKAPGRHHFVVRTTQYLGARMVHSFSLSPSHGGGSSGGRHDGEEAALVPSSGQGGSSVRADVVLAGHAHQLMRVNTHMFDGTIRALTNLVTSGQGEIADLRAENMALRREVEAARAGKMEREYQIEMGLHKNARLNAGFQKLMQIGTVVAAKLGGDAQPDASPLVMLFTELRRSLRQDQLAAVGKVFATHVAPLMGMLDVMQQALVMEILKIVVPEIGPEAPPAGNTTTVTEDKRASS